MFQPEFRIGEFSVLLLSYETIKSMLVLFYPRTSDAAKPFWHRKKIPNYFSATFSQSEWPIQSNRPWPENQLESLWTLSKSDKGQSKHCPLLRFSWVSMVAAGGPGQEGLQVKKKLQSSRVNEPKLMYRLFGVALLQLASVKCTSQLGWSHAFPLETPLVAEWIQLQIIHMVTALSKPAAYSFHVWTNNLWGGVLLSWSYFSDFSTSCTASYFTTSIVLQTMCYQPFKPLQKHSETILFCLFLNLVNKIF